MRGGSAVVTLAIALWIGAVLGGCFGRPPCECPAMRAIDPGHMVITRSEKRPELVGGEVEVTADKVTITVGDERVVFAVTRR
ncbi:MAG TPA: hypothetical protein VIV11_36830 [Kofleriaceae bacterium]